MYLQIIVTLRYIDDSGTVNLRLLEITWNGYFSIDTIHYIGVVYSIVYIRILTRNILLILKYYYYFR